MPAKILIVEDHEDSRDILKLQLQAQGYEVIEAENGQEGLEKALTEDPYLIVMDLGLPGIDGIEAAIRLKKNPKTADIPVIAHTAWSPEDYKEKAERAGMVAYLTKPTPPHLFKEVIQRVLQSKSSN